LKQHVLETVSDALGSIDLQIASTDRDDDQTASVLVLPSRDVRQQPFTGRAVRLAEEQQQRQAESAHRLERHRDSVQAGEAESWSLAVHGKAGRRRRLDTGSELRLERVDPQHDAAV